MSARTSLILVQLLRTLVVVIVLCTLGFLFRPNVLSVYRYFTADHSDCSLTESYQAANDTIKQISRSDELIATSTVSTNDSDGASLWTTLDGPWWTPTKSRNAVLYDLAEQDRDIYQTASGIKPGDVVLDCGANVGVFTKKALARGASRVIAIEPAPENLVSLRKNLASEIQSGKVVVYAKGVWDKDDILTMHIDPANSAADSFVRGETRTQDLQLPLTTIDHLVDELHLEKVDFIKMDIEGAERHAVEGAAQTIRRFHPRMALCVYHLSDDPVVVRDAVLSKAPGYQVSHGCMHQPTRVAEEVAHFRLK